jgi:hypothetical protein
MTAVAGEIQADEAVDHVERAGAQVDFVQTGTIKASRLFRPSSPANPQ